MYVAAMALQMSIIVVMTLFLFIIYAGCTESNVRSTAAQGIAQLQDTTM